MATIIDNPQGGRRMIRLTADDIVLVMSRLQLLQQQYGMSGVNGLSTVLSAQPIYLPEEPQGVGV